MTPIWLRLVVIGIGAAIFFGSWFVGNTVDSAEPAAGASGPNRYVMLQKDAITFFMRIIGAMVAIIGLLLWVAAGGGHKLL